MPTVTVPKMVRPGAGYGTIAARFGVEPTMIATDAAGTTVTFPDPVEGAEPLDLTEVAEWLVTPNDQVMAMRASIRAALATLDEIPPPPTEPTDQSRIARLEAQVGCLRAVLHPLVCMTLGITDDPEA